MDRVIVAFASEKSQTQITRLLESGGIYPAGCCFSGAEEVRMVWNLGSAVVICGFKLADQPAGELFFDLPDRCGMLVVARRSQLEMLPSADILRLPIPFTRRELTDAVEFLLDGYRRTEPSLRPRRGPKEKALVEAAKGLLMARKGLTEEEAHRALQQRSMESGLRMETLARQLTQQTK